MRDSDLDLTDQERRAIEAIGRELDREFGAVLGAPTGRTETEASQLAPAVPARARMAGIHVALAAGAGTLSAAVIAALATLMASIGPGAVGSLSTSPKPVVSGARLATSPKPAVSGAKRASAIPPDSGSAAVKRAAAAHRAVAPARGDAERGRPPSARLAGDQTAAGPLVAMAARSPAVQSP